MPPPTPSKTQDVPPMDGKELMAIAQVLYAGLAYRGRPIFRRALAEGLAMPERTIAAWMDAEDERRTPPPPIAALLRDAFRVCDLLDLPAQPRGTLISSRMADVIETLGSHKKTGAAGR